MKDKITKDEIADKYLNIVNRFENGDENVRPSDAISALHKLSIMYGHDTPKVGETKQSFKIVFGSKKNK